MSNWTKLEGYERGAAILDLYCDDGDYKPNLALEAVTDLLELAEEDSDEQAAAFRRAILLAVKRWENRPECDTCGDEGTLIVDGWSDQHGRVDRTVDCPDCDAREVARQAHHESLARGAL